MLQPRAQGLGLEKEYMVRLAIDCGPAARPLHPPHLQHRLAHPYRQCRLQGQQAAMLQRTYVQLQLLARVQGKSISVARLPALRFHSLPSRPRTDWPHSSYW